MENIVQILLEEATSWVPKVGGVVVIFVVFFILARIIKRIITNNAERLRLDSSLTSLFARTSSITLISFGCCYCAWNFKASMYPRLWPV